MTWPIYIVGFGLVLGLVLIAASLSDLARAVWGVMHELRELRRERGK